MSNKVIVFVCDLLNLGAPLVNPVKVIGGLLHTLWRVQTVTGEYAIKELNPVIMAKPGIIAGYELSEKIARAFSDAGIPAVTSLQYHDHSVMSVDNTFFIVYPWVNGVTLKNGEITVRHIQKMGAVFAAMQTLRLQMPGVVTDLSVHTEAYYSDLIKRGLQSGLPYVGDLEKIKNYIPELVQKYRAAIPFLQNNRVISHADLDPKNVLWVDDGPWLIDWESARYIHPAQEIINAALDWGGVARGRIDETLFDAMLSSYKNAGGIIDSSCVEAAFRGIVINWLNWIVYNIDRSLNTNIPVFERQLATEQVERVEIVLLLVEKTEHLVEKIKR